VVFLVNCETIPEAPDVFFCSLFDFYAAECNDPKGVEESFDIKTDEMLGYQCISPGDFSKLKVYNKKIQEALDSCKAEKTNVE